MATSIVSGNFVISSNLTPPGQSAPANTPSDALRRLKLPAPANEPWNDVVALDASDLETVGRSLDAQRETIETDYGSGTHADNALSKVDDLLAQADVLAAANEKHGLSTSDRQSNQKQLDALLKQVDDAIDTAVSNGSKVLDGKTTMTSGNQTVKIDAVALDTLGEVAAHGRLVSLKDFESHATLDTARHKPSAATLARASIAAARDQIKKIRTTIETFQENVMRPRLGDIATTLDGLYTARADTLTSTTDAMKVATDLRKMLVSGATFAAAVGSDGWDKQRLLALLQPATASALSSSG